MPVHVPASVDAAVVLLAQDPTATLLAGGTDLMVEVNDGHRRPGDSVVVVNRITELRSWRRDQSAASVTIGAGVSYREIETGPLGEMFPALGQAARTVGSPQIRNAAAISRRARRPVTGCRCWLRSTRRSSSRRRQAVGRCR
jgi:CO/xanthine dehydrogenase FAD-binding subunit